LGPTGAPPSWESSRTGRRSRPARSATAGSASVTECEMAAELHVNKGELTNLTQLAVHSFTHPAGAYDRRTRDAVVGAGYRSAAALKNAVSPAADDPFAIARWTVTVGTPLSRIVHIVEGKGVPRPQADEGLPTRAHRRPPRRPHRHAKTLGMQR
jgi:hypothetical protein